MPKPELPHILDLCPTCGSPKPCSLHDEEFLKGLLEEREAESLYELKNEWEVNGKVREFVPMRNGKVAVHSSDPPSVLNNFVVFDMSQENPQGETFPQRMLGRYNVIRRLSDNKMVAARTMTLAGNLRVYDMSSQPPEVKEFDQTAQDIIDFTAIGERYLLTIGKDSQMHIIDTAWEAPEQTKKKNRRPKPRLKSAITPLRGSNEKILSLATISDHEVIIFRDFGRVEMLDIHDPSKEFMEIANFGSAYQSLKASCALSRDKVLFTHSGLGLSMLDLSRESARKVELTDYNFDVSVIEKISDTEALIGGHDGVMYLMDISTLPAKKTKIGEFGGEITTISKVSSDFVLVGGEGKVQRWKLPSEEEIKRYHEAQIEEEIEEMPE